MDRTSSTTSQSNARRLNAICPYFTMFPLDVPIRRLTRTAPRAWVLDPFCGRGTTNFAARLLGLPSVGVDSNPVATAIAEGKLVFTNAGTIVSLCKEILARGQETSIPRGQFWSLCFHRRTLDEICRVRAELIADCRSPERKALRALMLGALHGPRNKGLPSYLSNQMPRTYAAKPGYATRFWTARNLRPVYVDLTALMVRKASYYFGGCPNGSSYQILYGDSRSIDFSTLGPRFSAVVTSPPYYGMRTYVPDQWLRYWFLGGPAAPTYTHAAQMSHGSPHEFAEQLSRVWANVARACAPGARWTIRFGGIHDRKASPRAILLQSLRATPGVRVSTVRSAGLSTRGKRQADQFRRKLRAPIEEFDFYARLEEPEG